MAVSHRFCCTLHVNLYRSYTKKFRNLYFELKKSTSPINHSYLFCTCFISFAGNSSFRLDLNQNKLTRLVFIFSEVHGSNFFTVLSKQFTPNRSAHIGIRADHFSLLIQILLHLLPWVKVRNFQNPELKKFNFLPTKMNYFMFKWLIVFR